MKKMSLFIVILAAGALLLSACGAKTAEPVAAQVDTQPQGVIAEGRVLPVNSLDQAFAISGQVAEVLVADGDSVKIGQPLARLADSPEASALLARARQEILAAQQALEALNRTADLSLAQSRQAYLAAKTEAETARDNFKADGSDENRNLRDIAEANLQLAEDTWIRVQSGNGIDSDQLAAAEVRLSAAQASEASAQALQDALTLTATLDGTVIDLTLQPGQQVAAGTPVIVLADTSSWIVQTENLTEMEVASLSAGQKVEVELDALPELVLAGEITHINARYEEKRGDITYTVTIRLDQTSPQVRWGMTAAVHFLP